MYKSPLKLLRYILLTGFFTFMAVEAWAENSSPQDSLTVIPQPSEREKLIRGQRLFNGLVYLQNKRMNCAECHNTRVSDTINWNPDAVEISIKYLDRTAEDLGRVLLNPSGKMAESHSGIKLTPDEIELIKEYMDTLPDKGLVKDKQVITHLFLFILASLLFIGALIDLMITRKLRKRWINIIVITISSGYITYELVVNAIALGRSTGYSPDQPIKFSHAVHAGQNGTDCIYCHSYAPYSKVSGFPSENVCMNCHLLVRTGSRSGTFEIAKVINAFENRQPIEWVQIHNLPDHTYYNHSQHVNAGKVDCRECHGRVEEMDRVRQVNDLSMGWCVNCHRTRKVNFSNEFYRQYTDLTVRVENGELDSVLVSTQGGTECMRCHY